MMMKSKIIAINFGFKFAYILIFNYVIFWCYLKTKPNFFEHENFKQQDLRREKFNNYK